MGLMLHGTANHAKAKKTRRTRRTRSPKRRKRRKRRSLARSTGHRAVCVCFVVSAKKVQDRHGSLHAAMPFFARLLLSEHFCFHMGAQQSNIIQ